MTANDISKFMKWWMDQPIREDLYDMAAKKKKVEAKKKSPMDVRKQAIGKTKMVQLAKKENVVVVKKPMKRVDMSVVAQGAKTGRVEGKKGVLVEVEKKKDIHVVKLQDRVTPKGGFEQYQEKKQAQRCIQEPVPEITEEFVEEIESDDTEIQGALERKRAWKEAQAEQETVVENGEDEEELSEDEITEIIEEYSTEQEEDEEHEKEQEEQDNEEVSSEEPNEESIALNMGLTALDAEALEHVLVEAINTFEIPENYIDSIESIIDGLKQ